MNVSKTNTKKFYNNDYLQYLVASILLGAAFIISIGVGRYPISVREIIDIITGAEVDSMTKTIFFTLRLPRTIMVFIAGIGLSIAGSVYQTIFKNPLATPDIIGVSSGANLGAAISISFFAGGTLSIAVFAFLGGISAVFIALALTRVSKDKGITTFVLAGIVIGSMAQGMIMLLKFFADPERQLAAIDFWSMGSFAGITSHKLISILPFFIIGIMGLILMRWQINVLSLSDEEGKSLGVRVGLVRVIVVISATLVVASIVCVTGLITFIGLIGPHIGRMLTRRNDFKTTVLSGIIGATILLIADCLARSLASSELPISILTTFIGAPFLAYLMGRLK
ncbi:iron complex transport system permease protein [Proteiniborus ethanoligenes]|uniref:Iron complex transport system permease protein n=1 Tax=Proteiniborus ethanoligenes TaxID=415015 RepID=A0A1H3QFY3_9FIRM|nr:iron ABC transporter permease [Proteiniborus ethanoligenes]SDZ12494.1 iron complex transport system permease protein [Proteiniborus ethanoligenes]